MSQDEREESPLSRLRRRIDELEERVEQERQTGGAPTGQGVVGATTDGRLVRSADCLRCEEGVLVTRGQRLVCTSCEYVRYL